MLHLISPSFKRISYKKNEFAYNGNVIYKNHSIINSNYTKEFIRKKEGTISKDLEQDNF